MISPAIAYTQIKLSMSARTAALMGLGGLGAAGLVYGANRLYKSLKPSISPIASTGIDTADDMAADGDENYVYRTNAAGEQVRERR